MTALNFFEFQCVLLGPEDSSRLALVEGATSSRYSAWQRFVPRYHYVVRGLLMRSPAIVRIHSNGEATKSYQTTFTGIGEP